MWYPMAWGMHRESVAPSAIAQLGAILVAGHWIAQLPLWLGSKLFGLRLASPRQTAHDLQQVDRQFRIRHMLLGTFLLAAALGLAKRLPFGRPIRLPDLMLEEELLAILVSVVVCNLILIVPTIWATFQELRKLPQRTVAGTGLAALITLLQFLVLCALLGDPGPDAPTIFWVLFLVNLWQCIAVAIAMLMLRELGFRLLRVAPATGS